MYHRLASNLHRPTCFRLLWLKVCPNMPSHLKQSYYIYLWVHAHACAHTIGGQRTTFKSCFSPSTTQVPGIKLRLSNVWQPINSRWTISPAWNLDFYLCPRPMRRQPSTLLDWSWTAVTPPRQVRNRREKQSILCYVCYWAIGFSVLSAGFQAFFTWKPLDFICGFIRICSTSLCSSPQICFPSHWPRFRLTDERYSFYCVYFIKN